MPDTRSIAIAKKYGIDITGQQARHLISADLDRFDLILAMDSSNYQNIVRLAINEEQRQKVKMIMNFANPGMNQNVPDPYWDDQGFEKVYQMLDEACMKLIDHFT
ncbi:MAG: hypothetical protein DHS20C18_13750 [Saprospiraceae bacterium]|nr:MAG: hypothetical protein DHS20C18_13750 [Saprospiraceae bacterium]